MVTIPGFVKEKCPQTLKTYIFQERKHRSLQKHSNLISVNTAVYLAEGYYCQIYPLHNRLRLKS